MSQPFIGEIRLFGASFAPAGWALCQGQLMPISENDALFTLLGTTYGGDGQETFGLPDLQGRVPVHTGGTTGYILGEEGGVESVTLTTQQIPAHTHAPAAAAGGGGGTTNIPGANTILADSNTTVTNPYVTPFAGASQIALNAQTITPTGGSQPHDNFQPTLCVSYIISLFGIFPQRN
jgi:microcystin-dependent protein